MKKIIALLVLFAILFSLQGCAIGGSTEVKLGETVTVEELAFKITNIEWRDSLGFRGTTWSPGNGNTFIVLSVTIINNSRKEISGDTFPTFTFNYDNGYDTHNLEGTWKYGTSTYIVQDVGAQDESSFTFLTDIPDIQINDNKSVSKIDIKFQGKNFVYYINNPG